MAIGYHKLMLPEAQEGFLTPRGQRQRPNKLGECDHTVTVDVKCSEKIPSAVMIFDDGRGAGSSRRIRRIGRIRKSRKSGKSRWNGKSGKSRGDGKSRKSRRSRRGGGSGGSGEELEAAAAAGRAGCKEALEDGDEKDKIN